jgi:hypothetical protein
MLAEIAEQLRVTPDLLVEPGSILRVEHGNRLLGRPGGIAHGTNRTVGADGWGRFAPRTSPGGKPCLNTILIDLPDRRLIAAVFLVLGFVLQLASSRVVGRRPVLRSCSSCRLTSRTVVSSASVERLHRAEVEGSSPPAPTL